MPVLRYVHRVKIFRASCKSILSILKGSPGAYLDKHKKKFVYLFREHEPFFILCYDPTI